MSNSSSQPPGWLRHEALHTYGIDAASYDAGRPEYPERVYELLDHRCGIKPGVEVLEIGPGTGQVTRRLVELGAEVSAVEPDQGLAHYLSTEMDGQPVTVIGNSFEEAALADDAYDMVIAAMSFHWVNQDVGLPKLGRVLRPGGWAALWWTVFGDPDRDDPFRDATIGLLQAHDAVASLHQPQFEVDVDDRTQDLSTRAGLVDVDAELIRWDIRLDPDAVRALYATMIRIRRLPPDEREPLLDAITTIAADDFNGLVERPFVTALYTARRPQS